MTYLIHARDGTGHIVLKRDTEEAALKKAAELKELGWFEVGVQETPPPQKSVAGAPST